MDITVKREGAEYVARIKGDRSRPRPVGRGLTWREAVRALAASEAVTTPPLKREFDDPAHPLPGVPRWKCTCGNWHSRGRACPVGGGAV